MTPRPYIKRVTWRLVFPSMEPLIATVNFIQTDIRHILIHSPQKKPNERPQDPLLAHSRQVKGSSAMVWMQILAYIQMAATIRLL